MTADSLHVHTRDGAGRPVVFLHGFASHGGADWPDDTWDPPLTARDQPRVVIDLPGHGESAGFGVEPAPHVLDRLAAAIADACGDAEVDLVGYSLGARLAWDLASHPSVKVRRVVLGGLSAGEPFSFVDVEGARSAVRTGDSVTDPLTGMIVGMACLPGNRPHALFDVVEGLGGSPFDPQQHPVVQPTLLIGGDADAMAAGIDDLAALLPDAGVKRVPGDHLAALHSPEFVAATLGFLDAD